MNTPPQSSLSIVVSSEEFRNEVPYTKLCCYHRMPIITCYQYRSQIIRVSKLMRATARASPAVAIAVAVAIRLFIVIVIMHKTRILPAAAFFSLFLLRRFIHLHFERSSFSLVHHLF
jgi:hypothetical protein